MKIAELRKSTDNLQEQVDIFIWFSTSLDGKRQIKIRNNKKVKHSKIWEQINFKNSCQKCSLLRNIEKSFINTKMIFEIKYNHDKEAKYNHGKETNSIL